MWKSADNGQHAKKIFVSKNGFNKSQHDRKKRRMRALFLPIRQVGSGPSNAQICVLYPPIQKTRDNKRPEKEIEENRKQK